MSKVTPTETVNLMWEAYQEVQTAAHVAKTCGVDRRTATKFIKNGDTANGVKPFETRFKELQEETQKKADRSLAKIKAESLTIARVYKAKMAEALKKKNINPDDLRVSDLDTLARLEVFLATDESEEGRGDPQIVITEAPQYPSELMQAIAHQILDYKLNNPDKFNELQQVIPQELDADFTEVKPKVLPPAPHSETKQEPVEETQPQ